MAHRAHAITSWKVTYTYATSAATVATVSTAGVVTAVAPGTATITITAAGTGTGFSATTLTSATTITVSDRTPGLTSLQVSPSTVSMGIGATTTVTANVQGARASAATITYGTSAPTVATVSSAGVITAVAAGTATITVTAQSTESGQFAASSITGLVTVTVTQPAQVTISNITIGSTNNPIDISNVADQIQVQLAVQPNGQTVSEANVWVCDPAETVAACAARTNGVPAARQSFGSTGAQASTVQLFINTAEFATPNFTTGADAATTYRNGLKTIVATLGTSPASSATIASNSISQVNFNNPDGWTISWTLPANRANDAAANTWYGGPSTPDELIAGAQSGTGSFTVVPVIYTPDRTVVQAVLNLSTTCGSNITDRTRPFSATYGTATRDTLAGNFYCGPSNTVSGTQSTLTGLAPRVVSAIDNNNGAYADVTLDPAAGRSIFRDFNSIANSTVNNGGTCTSVNCGYLQSLAYRPVYRYQPHDYRPPSIDAFDVRGGGLTSADSGWVNGAYYLAGTNPLSTSSLAPYLMRYRASDASVGLLGSETGTTAARRNTRFNVCVRPSPLPSALTNTSNTICAAPVASGGIDATITSIGLPENATNFTNDAYYVQAVETDRLGNRAYSTPFGWYNTSTGADMRPTARQVVDFYTYATPTTSNVSATSSVVTFGVDLTPPVLASIPNTGAGLVEKFVRTDVDSIYSALGDTYTGTNNTNAVFAVRFTDARSGFFACVAAANTGATAVGNCPTGSSSTLQVNAGTFQITRRAAPTLATVTNDAVVETLIRANTSADSAAATRSLNRINASASSFDGAYRDFTINIFGSSARITPYFSSLLTQAPAATVAGYYTFSGTLTDRAGNSTTIPSRSVAIDNANPQVTGITVPAVLAGGSTVTFGPAGTDDLEAVSADLSLRYPQLTHDNGVTGGGSAPAVIRFNRVNNFSTTAPLGFWHNPFASLTDNKLATPIGPGTTIGAAGLVVPIPFIQQIATVTTAAAPPTPAQLFANFGNVAGLEPRPNQVGARLYDIRATSPLTTIGNGRSAELTATIFGGQVPTPSAAAGTKNWTATGTGAVGITAWQISTTGGVSEFRATTGTSITNPPFSAVYIVRNNGTEWDYIGTATYAGPLDQGGNRYWRYTLSSSSIDQGNGVTLAALANGDNIKAIGVDASGNGLSTATSTFGLPLALPAAATFGPFAVSAINNGAAAQPITLNVAGAAAGANLVYGCSSSSTLVTAVMTSPTICTISEAGVAGASTSVTITFTVTGSGASLTTNTLSSTTTILRTP